jgi:hypothetical protein
MTSDGEASDTGTLHCPFCGDHVAVDSRSEDVFKKSAWATCSEHGQFSINYDIEYEATV